MVLDFTTATDCDRMKVEMYLNRTVRGDKLVGSGELKLLDVAAEIARGMGETRRFIVDLKNEVKDPKTGQLQVQVMGRLVMKLKQTDFWEPWETLKVQYWKRDGLPSTLSASTPTVAYDLQKAFKSLAVCP